MYIPTLQLILDDPETEPATTELNKDRNNYVMRGVDVKEYLR